MKTANPDPIIMTDSAHPAYWLACLIIAAPLWLTAFAGLLVMAVLVDVWSQIRTKGISIFNRRIA